MKKRSRFSFLFIMLLSFVMLTACSTGTGGGPGGRSSAEKDESGKKEGKIELRVAWWGSQTRHDRTLEAIKLFEEKNLDIVITPEFNGWDGYWERMATQAAGENLPDVVQMSTSYINEYLSRDLIADLGPFIKSGALNFNDVDGLYLDSGKVGDKLYSVNLGANALAIAYDPAMFEKAGVKEFEPGYTWDDYLAAAR